MKKAVFLMLFMLFVFSAAASAQVTIAGQSFSMLVVVPLVMIVIFVLIFGIVIAFDKYREIKERKTLENDKENKKAGIISAIREKAMEIEEKMPGKAGKEKEEKPAEKEYKPLAGYLDDIRSLRKKIKKLNEEDAFSQLVALIRGFFSDYLGISYEFTFDELEKEFKTKNKEVVFFSKNLSDMSYNAEGISKKRVVNLLDEFEDVAEKILLKEDTATEKKEEMSAKAEEKKVKTSEEKKVDEAKKTEHVEENKKTRIIELIREGKGCIKRDINRANDIYEEVYVLYHQLPKNKKRELQKKITEFYDAIRAELKS